LGTTGLNAFTKDDHVVATGGGTSKIDILACSVWNRQGWAYLAYRSL